MKHGLPLIVLSVLLILSGILAAGRAFSAAFEGASPVVDPGETDAAPAGGMPGWPVPEKPIPHHEPGHPSRAANYTTQVTRLNAEGIEETAQLTGLQAMVEDGLDPLVGNYRLVQQEDVLVSQYIAEWILWPPPGSLEGELNLHTRGLVDGSLRDKSGSWKQVVAPDSLYLSHDIAAGDLNGDFVDEQIAAWIRPGDKHVQLVIGEMPGSAGRTTSAPAAAHSDGGIDLLVRGYDDALWHYDSGNWSNDGGGILLSAPVIASRGDGTFDTFVIGSDNQLHQRHWNGSAWVSGWQRIDGGGTWPALDRVVPVPELPAPAAVAREGGKLDLFRLGPDNTLRWHHFDGTNWGAWQNLGGMLASGPGAVSLGPAHVQVFARGVDGALWSLASDPAGGADKSTTGHDGIDGALRFDGLDDHVRVPHDDSLNPGEEMTMMAWVHLEDPGADQKIVGKSPIGSGYILGVCDNQLYPEIWDSKGGRHVFWAGNIPAQTWTHLAVTWSTGTDAHMIGYINGQEVTRTMASTTTIGTSDRPLVIGAAPWDTRYYQVNGAIDEVAVFDRALSAGEISNIYGSGWTGIAGQVLGLHLDESPARHGATLADASGQGNDGTLYTGGIIWETDGSGNRWRRLPLAGMAEGVTIASAPTAVALDGQITVYARGSDNKLWYTDFDGASWGNWHSAEGQQIASAVAAAVAGDTVHLFAQAPDGSLRRAQRPVAGQVTWDATLWLDECCWDHPFDTGAVAYVDPSGETYHHLDDIEVATGHLFGDGREQIALAYMVNDLNCHDDLCDGGPAIDLRIYDIGDGFVPHLAASYRDYGNLEGSGMWFGPSDRVESPRIAIGDFDQDPAAEIALAYTTNTGAVRVYENAWGWADPDMGRSLSWNEETPAGEFIELGDYDFNDVASAISVAPGWSAIIYEHVAGGGDSLCFEWTWYTSLLRDIAHWNDRVSSIKIIKGDCPSDVPKYNYRQKNGEEDRVPLNGHWMVDVFDVVYEGGSWRLKLKWRKSFEGRLRTLPKDDPWGRVCSGTWVGEWLWSREPARSVNLAVGDFFEDQPQNGRPVVKDELAITLNELRPAIRCKYEEFPQYRLSFCDEVDIGAAFYVFDFNGDGFDEEVRKFAETEHFANSLVSGVSEDKALYSVEPPPVASLLAAGDWDGDGWDEVVRTWPYAITLASFDSDSRRKLHVERRLEVLDGAVDPDWEPISSIGEYETDGLYWRDALTLGHLGEQDSRDLADKIIYYDGGWLGGSPGYLYLFERGADGSITPMGDRTTLDQPGLSSGPVMVSGDFEAKGLRVGPPVHRRQYGTGGITAIINAPPRHFDVLDGKTYDINLNDAQTKAVLIQSTETISRVSVSTQRTYALADNFTSIIGDKDATHTTSSINNTYGEHFEKTEGAWTAQKLEQAAEAARSDALVYIRTDYDVWEYPVFDGVSDQPSSYISVVFPNSPSALVYGDSAECSSWYRPRHQLNNVWSYPSSVTELRDRKKDIMTHQTVQVGPDPRSFTYHLLEEHDTTQTRQVEMNRSSGYEKQIGGELIELNWSLGDIFGIDFYYRLPAVIWSGSEAFGSTQLSTTEIAATKETQVQGNFGGIPGAGTEGYGYTVESYLYWSDDGYMVLDYVTRPGTGKFWTNYNKPDPAFILPWADGHCDVVGRGSRAEFTRDVLINPPYARVGDTVTISATVRNFSSRPANNVKVAFYQGDPDAGGTLIGDDTIPTLGDRDAQTAGIQWAPEGSGEVHIYAVIDPGNQIAEMHDETDPPVTDPNVPVKFTNNNKGYRVLRIAATNFMDMGLASQQDYYPLTYGLSDSSGHAYSPAIYGLGHSVVVAIYTPLGNLSETPRLELKDAPLLGGNVVGKPFELAAYTGKPEEGGWDQPFEDFTLKPGTNDPPAVVTLAYGDADIAGMDEANLTLYRLGDRGWEEATCSGYPVHRFPEDNLIAVPVCQTGVFAFSDETPTTRTEIYLPLVLK